MANNRSEGERIIEEYLKEEDIKFLPEVKISNLIGDSIPYRKADFYLPQFKTYIEFLGRWNVESNRESYREKMRIYKNNNIPCIYIYPDNLGILDFILKNRLRDVLKKHNYKFQLFRLNYRIFQEKYAFQLIVLGVLIYYIDNSLIRLILGAYFVFQFYIAIRRSFFD